MMQDIWSSGVVAVAASCLNNNFDTQPGATDLDKWDGIFSVRDTNYPTGISVARGFSMGVATALPERTPRPPLGLVANG